MTVLSADFSTGQPIKLAAMDGYPLAATLYPAKSCLLGNLIVAGATGVQQRFYRRFAEYASRRGFSVLTLDYRGIGGSKPDSLKSFKMSYQDWGSLDLTAAVEYVDDGITPLYWIGHSFGSQALGLIPNHHKVTAAYCFGVGAGWIGWMPRLEAIKVRLLWSLIMPLIVSCKGYMAWSLLGMGDDLPLGVYRDWRRWCAYPHHLFDDPKMTAVAKNYAQVRIPCIFANAIDDRWAPPASRDAFIKGYSNAPLMVRNLSLDKAKGSIGHMGYFRESFSTFWDEALEWFAVQSPSEQPSPCRQAGASR
ncbi:alpha/beta fold hydrolase [Pseudomonas sp. C11]|uniref:alpha/beta hydrolase family protein n=1 Tax=Pseudomonas sp. C11 TaxID=3075550 RepID=UPI002AFFC7EF|nr:alpha/beta fold hydrolase [Pseudomonas sp. C11]